MTQQKKSWKFSLSSRTIGRFLLSVAAQTVFGSWCQAQVEVALLIAPVLPGASAIRSKHSRMLVSSLAVCVFFLACFQQAFGVDTDKTDLGKNAVSEDSKPANVGWTKFQDSFEKAFSLSVPQGWTVQGGLFRLGFSDARGMISIKSPDGKIDLRIGDLAIPVYTAPGKYRAREGLNYDLGAEAQLVFATYRTGPQFAALYSQARFGTVCQDPQKNPSHINFTMPDYSPLDFTPKHSSAGQIAWLCQTSDGPRVALTFARTVDAGQMWGVLTLVSLLAPPDQVQQARDIALHCVRSLKLEPKWIAYQHNMEKEGLEYMRARQDRRTCWPDKQIHQFESRMREMQEEVTAFEQHRPVGGTCFGRKGELAEILDGVTPTVDPLATNAPGPAFH